MKKCLKLISLMILVFVLLFTTSNISFAITQNVIQEKREDTNETNINNNIEQESDNNIVSKEETKNNEEKNSNEQNVLEKEEQKTENIEQEVTKNQEQQISIQSNALSRNGTYVGDATHQILEIHLSKNNNGSGYIWGKFIYVEWVNGVSTVPSENPTVTLKDDENIKNYECFVSQEWGNTYYFDIFIDEFDFNMTYNFEVTSGDENNISENKVSNLKINNQTLGEDKDYNILIQNNQLVFNKITYVGDATHQILEIHINKNSNGSGYIWGKFIYVEWVNGVSTVPCKNPTVTLKNNENTKNYSCYVKQEWGNTYYFDIFVDNLEYDKTYNFEVASGDSRNISENQVSNLKIGNQKLGENKDYNVLIQDNKLTFQKITYVGDALSELASFGITNTQKGNSYIYGNLIYVEWINGISTVPEKNPIVTLETEDGKIVSTLYVNQISGNTYYFDGYIDEIDTSKNYYIKTESGDSKNISPNKKATLNLLNKVGKYSDYAYDIYLNSNNTITINKNVYYGDATNEIIQFNLTNTVRGYSYISGQVIYIEWVNGVSTVPEFMPRMLIKSTDGTYEKELFVSQVFGNTYYFDGYIEGIDTDKQYYLEMQSGDFRNESENKNTKVNFSSKKGQYKNFKYTVTIDNNNIISLKAETYLGSIATRLNDIYLTDSGNGGAYLAGTVIYVEWVNGVSTVPAFNPIIRLKSTDGTYIREMYVSQSWGNTYYFDTNIDNINVNKEYYIEVETGDLRNIVETKTNRVATWDKDLGITVGYKGYTQNNVIKFQKINYSTGTYGVSGLKSIGDGRGQDLRYYKIGKGPNVMFAVFSVHGFEDQWNYDGQELTYIAEQFKNKLIQMQDMNIENKWTIYIMPSVNPDGANYGWSNNGPGRLTLHSNAPGNGGIDLNRCWHISGTSYQTYNGRNYNGTAGFQANEAASLRDFMLSHQSSSGRNIVIDLHGWLNETIGDSGLGSYYRSQFGMSHHIESYGTGYLVNWARSTLRSCRSTLVEMPATVWNHSDVVNQNFAGKYIEATLNVLRYE